MVPATFAPWFASTRRVRIALALASLVGQPGCARFRSFRHDDRPAFGTEVTAEAARKPGRPVGGDLYADRVGQSQLPAEPSPARRTPEPAEAELASATEVSRSGLPVVSLSPPSTVNPAEPVKPDGAPDDRPTHPGTVSSRGPGNQRPERSGPQTDQAAAPELGVLLAGARRRLDGLGSYQVKMNHQERVGGTLNPAEDVILSIRNAPRAVRLEWPSGPNHGREVIYAGESSGGLMHVHMPNSLIPRVSMRPDSPLAVRNSRHPITEAGFDTIISNMEDAYARQRKGDFSLGKIRSLGLEKSELLDAPCQKIVRVTPDNETWVVYLDPVNQLPTLVQATDGQGELLERYKFVDPIFEPPALAAAEAFDPDLRWGPSRGNLFQRMARGNPGAKPSTETR